MIPTSSHSFRIHAVLFCLCVFSHSVIYAGDVKPIRALLVLGGCCHDYNAQKDFLAKGIAERAHVEVVIALDKDTSTGHNGPCLREGRLGGRIRRGHHDECSSDVKDLAIIDRILEPHRQGLPAVLLHCGMHSYRSEGYPKSVTPWFEFTGLQMADGRQTPIHVNFSDPAHPIRTGLTDWTTVNEELYNNSEGKLLETATALACGSAGRIERRHRRLDEQLPHEDSRFCDDSRAQQCYG